MDRRSRCKSKTTLLLGKKQEYFESGGWQGYSKIAIKPKIIKENNFTLKWR